MKAFITGITGFVGSHLADYLLESGVDVYGLSRWRSPKEYILHCIDKMRLCHGDLLDFSSIYKCIDGIRPDYIFHLGAQSYVPYSFLAPSSTLETNCTGTCNLLEAIKLVKLKNGFDPIVHICSSSEVYGQVTKEDVPITENCPFRPASPYAVSKAGVISLTRTMAIDLAPYNINVNAICPALIWTSMWEKLALKWAKFRPNLSDLTAKEIFNKMVSMRIPLNRPQTPEDIGNLVTFLASDLAINITGQTINVDGGSRTD